MPRVSPGRAIARLREPSANWCRSSGVNVFRENLELLASLVKQRQGPCCSAGSPHYLGKKDESHGEIVIGAGIRLLARRLGPLVQPLRTLERLAQPPAGELLLNAGSRRLEPRVIPGVLQRGRCGFADPPHPLQQPRLAEHFEQDVEQGGQTDRPLRIPGALDEVQQHE